MSGQKTIDQKPLKQPNMAVPRAQKKKTKRAAGSPAASTQLALCLRLAYDV
jgi:hypothetical protein